MHDGVVWFDTKACWSGGYIGQANEAVYKGSYLTASGWHTDTAVEGERPNYDDFSRLNTDSPTRKPAWDTDLNVGGG